MPTVTSCVVHPDCLVLAVAAPYIGQIAHLSRDEARALSHALYYASTDDDFAELGARPRSDGAKNVTTPHPQGRYFVSDSAPGKRSPQARRGRPGREKWVSLPGRFPATMRFEG